MNVHTHYNWQQLAAIAAVPPKRRSRKNRCLPAALERPLDATDDARDRGASNLRKRFSARASS